MEHKAVLAQLSNLDDGIRYTVSAYYASFLNPSERQRAVQAFIAGLTPQQFGDVSLILSAFSRTHAKLTLSPDVVEVLISKHQDITHALFRMQSRAIKRYSQT
jgi:hypothetical protein